MTVTISKKEYNKLIRAYGHLNELENRGVDNWVGYVGEMFYCSSCDKDSEWIEYEGKCPACGEIDD